MTIDIETPALIYAHSWKLERAYVSMTTCERCGQEIPEHETICPSCETPLSETQASSQPTTEPLLHAQKKPGALPFDSLYEDYVPQLAPTYDRNYAARPANPADAPAQEVSSTEQEKASTAPPTTSTSSSDSATTFITRLPRFSQSNTTTPLIIDVLLSLCIGIFGVGWLLIGEKRIGTLLLVASAIFYLPLLIISYVLAYFSLGLSVLCTGPFVVGAVVLNAFMLHKTTLRKIPG